MDNFLKIKKKIERSELISKLVFIPFLLVFLVPITYGLLGGSFNWIIFLIVGFLFILVMLSAYLATRLATKVVNTFKNEITKPILADFHPDWKLDIDQGMDRHTIDSLEFLRSKYGDLYTGNSVTGKYRGSFFQINDISLSTTYPARGENDSSETIVHYKGTVFMMELGDVVMNPIHLFSGFNADFSNNKSGEAFSANKGTHLTFENSRFAKNFTVFSHNEGIRDIFDSNLQADFLKLQDKINTSIRIVLSGAKIYIALENKYDIWDLSHLRNEKEVEKAVEENVELIRYLVTFSEAFTQKVFSTKNIWQK